MDKTLFEQEIYHGTTIDIHVRLRGGKGKKKSSLAVIGIVMPNLLSTAMVKCLSRLLTEVQTITESCIGCCLFAVIIKHVSLRVYIFV